MTKPNLAENKSESARILPGGKYEIIKAAGQGGAGEVFSVYDRKLHRIWAAKRVRPDCPGMEEEVLGRMDEEIFPRIVDVVEDTECRYLIMDWIDGETLQERLMREGAMDVREGIRVGIALGRAIGALHAMQPPLLYLDCKPSNIMMDKNGRLRLIDFGSALESRETEVAPIAGSFGYGAPEQFGWDGKSRRKAGVDGTGGNMQKKRRADERSDVYGVGRTLYALLSGMDLSKPPYGTCRLRECNPAVPPALEKLVERCTQEQPEARYQTMDAVTGALEKLEKDLYGFWKRLVLHLATWLLLGLTVWRAGYFYGIAEEKETPPAEKLLPLCVVVLLATASHLWQYYVVDSGYCGRCRWDPEPLQSVLRTQKRAGKWLFAFFFGGSVLMAAQNGQASGKVMAEEVQEHGALPVRLRDEKLRRLLVKKGCALETAGSVFLELDPSLFEPGKVLDICITAQEEDGNVRTYCFRYLPLKDAHEK